jgi:zinc transporter, ZIP family
MPDLLVLFLAACGTALATGLGAIPVWFLGTRAAALTPFLLGLAAGVMAVASIAGLLIPAAEEGSALDLAAGLVLGGVLLGVARSRLDHESVFMGRSGPGARTSALVFAVLFVHSLPEGLAVGTAYASERAGLGLFVILAIAIQNIPEGTSVAIPMEATGYGRARQFWAAVGTSAPQPVGAVIAYLAVEEVNALLPFSFAFAAGAMLSLIAIELLPQAYGGRRWFSPTLGIAIGAGVMMVLDLLLAV